MKTQRSGLIFILCALVNICTAHSKPQSWTTIATSEKPSSQGIEAKLKDSHRYLCVSNYCTRIPTDSILYLPDSLQEKVSTEKKGQMITWFEFLRKNQSWLRVHPVSWDTVNGRSPLSPETLKGFTKQPYLVIASFKQCPISVLDPA